MTRERREPGIGLIGCGHIAQLRHVPALRRLRGARVVAVADTDPGALSAVGDALGVERRHALAASLLAEPEVDAVGVVVPAKAHAAVVLAALDAGKHVLVEKPLAHDLGECDRMVEAAARRPGLVTMVGFNLRFHRLLRAARSVVASGRLGSIDSLSAVTTGCAAGVDPETYLTGWRGSRADGGGALLEKGPHHYDLWRWVLASEAVEVSALSRSAASDDEAAVVIGRMESGALVSSVLGHAEADSHELTLHGSRGTLEVGLHEFDGLRLRMAGTYAGSVSWRLRRTAAALAGAPRALAGLRGGGDFVASYHGEWRHFLRCIRGEAAVESGIEDGREAARIALATVEAARTGEAVAVSRAGAAAVV